jgi:predicted transcriptional regulator of viral defense system
MPGRAFLKLLDHAHQQYGYITPDDARELHLDPTVLRIMAARDLIERVHRGIYRMPAVPVTGLDEYMAAVLWTRRRGVLSHETALDLYDLCDVNPTAIHLTVPVGWRTRKATPATYRLHHEQLGEQDVGWHEGIPIVAPERAIRGAVADGLAPGLAEQAIRTAVDRGLITGPVAAALPAERNMRAHTPRVHRA